MSPITGAGASQPTIVRAGAYPARVIPRACWCAATIPRYCPKRGYSAPGEADLRGDQAPATRAGWLPRGLCAAAIFVTSCHPPCPTQARTVKVRRTGKGNGDEYPLSRAICPEVHRTNLHIYYISMAYWNNSPGLAAQGV